MQTVKNPPGTVKKFREWFGKVLFNEVNRTGDVSELTWDAMVLWTDTAEMCNNLAVTHRRRALFVSSPGQRELRATALLEAVNRAILVKFDAALKHATAITSNRQAEAEILLAAGIIQVDDAITKQTERVDNAHAQREAMSDDVVQEHIKIVTEGEAHFAAISTTLKCRDFIRARKGEKFPVAKGRALIRRYAAHMS